MMIFFKF